MNQERREQLLRQAREDKRVFHGHSSGTDWRGNAVIIPNVRPKATPVSQGKFIAPKVKAQYDFNLEPLKKRTPGQRVEALAARLLESVKNNKPGEMQLILQQMAEEGWKSGSPVSYEEVKRVAIEAMRKAAGVQAEEQRRKF